MLGIQNLTQNELQQIAQSQQQNGNVLFGYLAAGY
jgi:hypothetical protein